MTLSSVSSAHTAYSIDAHGNATKLSMKKKISNNTVKLEIDVNGFKSPWVIVGNGGCTVNDEAKLLH